MENLKQLLQGIYEESVMPLKNYFSTDSHVMSKSDYIDTLKEALNRLGKNVSDLTAKFPASKDEISYLKEYYSKKALQEYW
ncbi:MAG TPA: hypothetical protein VMT76_09180 [Puia sp.]|nr:hypothetical protein [Puia sp.]